MLYRKDLKGLSESLFPFFILHKKRLMRILMITFFACIVSCKTVKDANDYEDSGIENYQLSPDHSILRVEVISSEDDMNQFKLRIVKVMKMSSGFPQVNIDQVLNVESTENLQVGVEINALISYFDSKDGPSYILKKNITN